MFAKHRLMRSARWAALAAGTMVLAGATIAVGAVQRRATVDVPPQAVGSATAKCRDGQVALAAGVRLARLRSDDRPAGRTDRLAARRQARR
jgi:hypothetical protein